MNKTDLAEKFNNIVTAIYDAYEGAITEEEARKAARNFVGFCQKVIEVQIRIETEKEKKDIENNKA
ncbi:hypothetical protein [Rickettsia endosymbiont of Polydrusus tereticollis]|uniref:hypothetical protein n=1 Tax=Rickettsia endosymbiont of Polydrusus tereticollis TaxID=3066251 RepID=UPI003133304E